MLLSQNKENQVLTLGILGGGQLAKMLLQEAFKMGLNVSIIESSENSPAGMMTKLDFGKGWNDKEELDRFIEASDVITLENEFINPDILEYIEQKRKVYPSSATMRMIQDKFIQKTNFANAQIPLANFEKIEDKEAALAFSEKYGYPYVLKTRTLGYDGYGNATIKSEDDIDLAFEKFTSNGSSKALYAEQFISFSKELAVMIVRNEKGEITNYPCVETVQKNHICHTVTAPAQIDDEAKNTAIKLAIQCVEAINGVGVFGIELFYANDGSILVNEIAPRPHNSGHYTIEACYTSQYENGIRAVLGLPLGSTKMRQNVAIMVNLLGERDGMPVPISLEEFMNTDAKLHLYGKQSSRLGRKMGHFTITADSIESAREEMNKAINLYKW